MTKVVEITNMHFTRGERTIYENISLSVAKGGITAIMGPSGIGKTTLLKIIGGQLVPNSGDVIFQGENVHI